MENLNDTICAPATLPGTGAISIVRVSGPDTFKIIDSQVSFLHGCASQAKGYTLKRGRFGELDDILVAIFRSPASYTGEDSAELYCHASAYIVQHILDALCRAGCRLAEAGEFSRRAFLSGKMDLAQAEAVADVIASQTEAQHRIAMNQLKGGYSAELGKVREQLLELSALVELELDFSEEDVEFADRERLRGLLEGAAAKCEALAGSFRVGNAIRSGVPIAIVGEPNSGKSTLLNALLGDERAIVSEFAGTTRDTVEECAVIGGMLFRFIDTAGIRESDDPVEKMGIGRSIEKLRSAEIVLVVSEARSSSGMAGSEYDGGGEEGVGSGEAGAAGGVPGSEYDGDGEEMTDAWWMDLNEQEKRLLEITDCQRQKVILLRNKCDLLRGKTGYNKNVSIDNTFVLPINHKDITVNILEISAKQGTGLDHLRQMLANWAGQDRNNEILVTNARHADALRRSSEALRRSISALDNNLSAELLAEDLRAAISHISEITGEITTDEILGEIFGRFCIGK
ncbi:MAG: tRNA uridine-5-carboxymethylaminomethyl(34) synthesis GTPase MnmE [Candidatus Cryptobacteroides sp.]|nr:tRNA uridine-5-carboxymethylaminomethyl(34) synthesis GTPase MnmE [Candidatus Cryptobacteroides sp.]